MLGNDQMCTCYFGVCIMYLRVYILYLGVSIPYCEAYIWLKPLVNNGRGQLDHNIIVKPLDRKRSKSQKALSFPLKVSRSAATNNGINPALGSKEFVPSLQCNTALRVYQRCNTAPRECINDVIQHQESSLTM